MFRCPLLCFYMFLVIFACNIIINFLVFSLECVVYFLLCGRLFLSFVFLVSLSPHWNQEEEHENKRPHDKKYTTHSKEEKNSITTSH
jgi:hypothetical protein